VYNPRATTTTPRQRDVLLHALAAEAKLDVEETRNRGHAAALACRAMRDRFDGVIALGGDGTVNEICNGLLTDGVHSEVPALGIVPTGSTNVFARALGIPNDPVDATAFLLDALEARRTRSIGLGRADDRYFVFTAGLGYDAAVVADVENQRRRGKKSTHSLYVRLAVQRFFKLDRRNPQIAAELAGGRRIDDLYWALVTNCTPWTFLGSREISPTPEASFDTGLDLYARTRMGLPGVLWDATRWNLGKPSLKAEHFGGRLEHDQQELTLRCATPQPFQVDGDYLGKRSEIVFRAVPNAVRVFL
jgi:diacylglycerol kinase family enzyme